MNKYGLSAVLVTVIWVYALVGYFANIVSPMLLNNTINWFLGTTIFIGWVLLLTMPQIIIYKLIKKATLNKG